MDKENSYQSRAERVKKLAKARELEEKQIVIQENIKVIEGSYFKDGTFSLKLKSAGYGDNGSDAEVRFDKELMINYLKKELEETDKLIKSVITNLYN